MIYFASDFHLGIDLQRTSREREELICNWLEDIRRDAQEIYLLGDLFDFWFEYQSVVPRGFVRLLGKLAEIRDGGIPITVFTGNHDMWLFNYFEEELNIPVVRNPIRRNYDGKKFLIGHGDGLGPGDKGYKRLKKIFANPFCQWLFARLHPNFGFAMARYWSNTSREHTKEDTFLGPEKEWLIRYCEDQIKTADIDYFIFGHRHMPIDCTLSNGHSRYINLGDWMTHFTYAVFDGEQLRLRFFLPDNEAQLIKINLSDK